MVTFFYYSSQLPSNGIASALPYFIQICVIKMFTSIREVIGEVVVDIVPCCVHMTIRLNLELIAVEKWKDIVLSPEAEVVQHATRHRNSQLLW